MSRQSLLGDIFAVLLISTWTILMVDSQAKVKLDDVCQELYQNLDTNPQAVDLDILKVCIKWWGERLRVTQNDYTIRLQYNRMQTFLQNTNGQRPAQVSLRQPNVDTPPHLVPPAKPLLPLHVALQSPQLVALARWNFVPLNPSASELAKYANVQKLNKTEDANLHADCSQFRKDGKLDHFPAPSHSVTYLEHYANLRELLKKCWKLWAERVENGGGNSLAVQRDQFKAAFKRAKQLHREYREADEARRGIKRSGGLQSPSISSSQQANELVQHLKSYAATRHADCSNFRRDGKLDHFPAPSRGVSYLEHYAKLRMLLKECWKLWAERVENGGGNSLAVQRDQFKSAFKRAKQLHREYREADEARRGIKRPRDGPDNRNIDVQSPSSRVLK